jgi:hypothetical protein
MLVVYRGKTILDFGFWILGKESGVRSQNI